MTLACITNDGEVRVRGRTDSDGRFLFKGFVPGSARLLVGTREAFPRPDAPAHPIEIGPGRNLLDIDLPDASVRLLVEDAETGGPLRARITLAEGVVMTDSRGRARLVELDEREREIVVSAKGHASRRLTVRPSSDPAELRVPLTPASELVVVVVDPEGAPVANAVVSLTDSSGRAVDARGRNAANRFARPAFLLARGTYRVRAVAAGFESAEETVRVPAGEPLRIVLRRK